MQGLFNFPRRGMTRGKVMFLAMPEAEPIRRYPFCSIEHTAPSRQSQPCQPTLSWRRTLDEAAQTEQTRRMTQTTAVPPREARLIREPRGGDPHPDWPRHPASPGGSAKAPAPRKRLGASWGLSRLEGWCLWCFLARSCPRPLTICACPALADSSDPSICFGWLIVVFRGDHSAWYWSWSW